ncbi:MAG: CPBP family intramembrane metalloprotease [Coriobacteriia bacterium]|nr:CPBP family intramembrane metalloprotease [Coriobacteriia bacterium]
MTDLPEPPAPIAAPGVRPDTAPLTAAPWSVQSALAFAGLAILFNMAMSVGLRWAPVVGAVRSAVTSAARLTGLDRATLGVAATVGVMTVLYALLLVAPVLVARSRGVGFAEAVGLRKAAPSSAAGAVLGAVGLALGASAVYGWVVTGLGFEVPGGGQEIARLYGTSPAGIVLIFVMVAVVAPLAEEIVFRGVVFASLRDAWGEPWALAMSSFAFGIIHLQPLQMVPTAVIGLVLARAFSRTRSLWPAVVAHGIYNGLVLAAGLALNAAAR